MKGNRYAVVYDFLPIREGLKRDVAQPGFEDLGAWRGGKIMSVARARMVCVCMRDNGSLDWQPRVDIKFPRHAQQTLFCRHHQIGHLYPFPAST
jgi:hypothetical protein